MNNKQVFFVKVHQLCVNLQFSMIRTLLSTHSLHVIKLFLRNDKLVGTWKNKAYSDLWHNSYWIQFCTSEVPTTATECTFFAFGSKRNFTVLAVLRAARICCNVAHACSVVRIHMSLLNLNVIPRLPFLFCLTFFLKEWCDSPWTFFALSEQDLLTTELRFMYLLIMSFTDDFGTPVRLDISRVDFLHKW